jgi:phosphoserine phosphatase RsbU/P
MSIQRKLLILLLTVSLVPLGATFALRQLSMRLTKKHIEENIHSALDKSAKKSLEQLLQHYHDVMAREQLLMEGLILRQARETELWLEQGHQQEMQGLTSIYKQLSSLCPKGLIRQQTVLLDGSYVCNPPEMAPGVDVQGKPWFAQVRQTPEPLRVGPYVDSITQNTVITIAMPVFQSSGILAGATAIDRHIPDFLAKTTIPEQWREGAERFVAHLDKRDGDSAVLTVFLRGNYTTKQISEKILKQQTLTSDNPATFDAMINDMKAQTTGIRRMGYQGTDALWAYGKASPTGMLPVLIIPYERVMELAGAVEDQLMGQRQFWWRMAGVVLLVVFLAAMVAGVTRANNIIHPIDALIEASAKLAAGDYAAAVKIETHDELQRLGEAFNEIGPHLQERQQMKYSLEMAGAIQQNLLPKEAPKLEHFEIAGKCVYCDQTGGDYFDFIQGETTGSKRIGIALGDVTGHGIGAALLMAAVRGLFRHSAREFGDRLQELFAYTNTHLAQDTDDDKFITLFYGLLDDQQCSLTWASGGHDPAIWYHGDTGMIEELPNTGPPLGLMEDMVFKQAGPIQLKRGDILVIGTDGIWETIDTHEEPFGRDRLKSLIRTHSDQSAALLCSTICTSVVDYVYPGSLKDDVTLVAIKAL